MTVFTFKRIQLLQLVLLFVSDVVLVTSKPYILLYTSQFKCLQTFESEETDLYIEYEIPDLVVLPEDDSSSLLQQQMETPPPAITTREDMMKYRESREAVGNDLMYNQRQNRNLNAAAKIHKRSSVNVKISEKEPYWNDEPLTGAPKEIELKNHTGYEVYKVQFDSVVEICFQSLTASSLTPVRLHIRVTDIPPKHIREELQQKHLKTALEILEDQIETMTHEVQQILRDGDYLKDFERIVWSSNQKLFKATMIWPCIRIFILIVVMGLGPSIYLVHFFRQRGLIY